MGNILTTYTPQELEEEERNWAAVRLQYACRGLIDVRRWSSSSGVGQEGEKGRRVNEWMRGEVQKMLGRCCIGENGGWKAIAEEDVRRCEEWTQGMFSGRGRGE